MRLKSLSRKSYSRRVKLIFDLYYNNLLFVEEITFFDDVKSFRLMSNSGKLFFYTLFLCLLPIYLLLEVKFLASLRGNSLTKEIILFRLTKLFRTFAPQKENTRYGKTF